MPGLAVRDVVHSFGDRVALDGVSFDPSAKRRPDLVVALNAAGDAGAFDIEYVTRDSQEELRQAVRDGDATVGLSGDTSTPPLWTQGHSPSS